MAGHSRPKDGVASLAYVPAIHVFLVRLRKQDVDARDKRGHDGGVCCKFHEKCSDGAAHSPLMFCALMTGAQSSYSDRMMAAS